MRLSALFLLCSSLFAANAPVYVLDAGALTFTASNSGALGGSRVATVANIGSANVVKVWFDPSGHFFQRGSETACAAPCSISMNMQMGRVGMMMEITDPSGVSFSPARISSILFLPLVEEPHLTAPFALPIRLIGFTGYEKTLDIAVPSGTYTNTYVKIQGLNIKPGNFAVSVNGGAEHGIDTIPVVGYASNGTDCVATTQRDHGFIVGQQIQQSGFVTYPTLTSGAIGTQNGLFTISAKTANTYTIASCGLASGSGYNTGSGTAGQNVGKVVTGTNFYCNDSKYWGGLLSDAHETCLLIPLGASEIVSGATNTLTLRYKGVDAAFIRKYKMMHGIRITGVNIVQAGKSCSGTVTKSSTSATLTCTGHGYSSGNTVEMTGTPGFPWRFDGPRVLTGVTTNTLTYAWGPASGAGSGIYTIADADYAVPTSQLTSYFPQAVIMSYKAIIPRTDFTTAADPSTFTGFGGNASNGATIWSSATLRDPGPYNQTSSAHCSSCHSKDARDLKVFGYEPATIKVACMDRLAERRFTNLESDCNDLVEYVLARPYATTAKGRPENPPYQPGPGLDSGSIEEWEAGAGSENCLNYDKDMAEFLIPGGSYATWAYNSLINNRELPIPFCLARWNQWLPEVAPEDAFAYFGDTFSSSAMNTTYTGYASTLKFPKQLAAGVSAGATGWTTATALLCTTNDKYVIGEGASREFVTITSGCGTTSGNWDRGQTIQGITYSATNHSTGAWMVNFTAFAGIGCNTQSGCLTRLFGDANHDGLIDYELSHSLVNNDGATASPGMWYRMGGSLVAWTRVKYHELFTTYRLQDVNDITARVFANKTSISANAYPQDARGWPTGIIFHSGPHKHGAWSNATFLGNVDNGRGGGFFDDQTMIWYHTAQMLTSGNRLEQTGDAIDWQYTDAYIQNHCYTLPLFHMKTLWHPVQTQQTVGYPTPKFLGGNMALESLNFGKTFAFQYCQQFSDQTTVGNNVKRAAVDFAALLAVYSTADWQDWTTQYVPLNDPLDIPKAGRGENANIQSSIALALLYMGYYGASSTYTNAIVSLADTIWPGYNFGQYVTAGPIACSLSGTPSGLVCAGYFP